MSTGSTAPPGTTARAAGPTPRIVRIARAAGPILAALVVILTVRIAVPHSAWLPWIGSQRAADAWEALPHWPQDQLAALQIWAGQHAWPVDPIGGAIGVAAALAGLATLVLAVALRATGLTVPLASLVAVLAASGPLLAWQAGSPLGSAPATLVSALVLWRFVRQRVRVHVTWFGTLAATAMAAVGAVMLLALATLAARWLGAWPAADTLRLIRGDVGVSGLVLLLPALGRRHSAIVPRERVWLGALVIWLFTTTIAPATRAAMLVPWVWWLIGAGIAQVIDWRGPRATRWAFVGVAIWIGLGAARIPWGQQHQHAPLVRTWAEGIAGSIDDAHPLVPDASAQGKLVGAIVRPDPEGRVRAGRGDPPSQARGAIEEGRRPVVASAALVEPLRWGGVALDAMTQPAGTSLERIIETLPRGTVVLAAISRTAARTLTPPQWQALGRVGLRLADAGAPRAHAVAGVTRARVEALEVAHADHARLAVTPGDPLGRTGTVSPVDARLEADAQTVRVYLRDRPFLDRSGIALLLFTTRGDFLGWRAGVTAAHLDGPALGDGPLVRSVGVETLPCTGVPAGATVDVTPLTHAGALGITWSGPGDMRLRVARPPGIVDTPFRIDGDAADRTLPTLSRTTTQEYLLSRSDGHRRANGLLLRGPLEQATATSTIAASVCAAWPMASAIDPAASRVEMPVLPRFDASFADGWHDIEVGRGGYFRWMAGARAAAYIALRRVAAFRFTLDAQPVTAPGTGDTVRLIVNGHALSPRAMHHTRGLYTWDVPPDSVREGVNRIVFETTLTLRPADVTPGGDARTLGLLVYGWSSGPAELPDVAGR